MTNGDGETELAKDMQKHFSNVVDITSKNMGPESTMNFFCDPSLRYDFLANVTALDDPHDYMTAYNVIQRLALAAKVVRSDIEHYRNIIVSTKGMQHFEEKRKMWQESEEKMLEILEWLHEWLHLTSKEPENFFAWDVLPFFFRCDEDPLGRDVRDFFIFRHIREALSFYFGTTRISMCP